MCGLIGEYGSKTSFVSRGIEFLKRRGPDHNAHFEFENCILGHTRLAIVDLDDRSNQPLNYKNWAIVFNGEIYNYKSIRERLKSAGHKFRTNSDTEVICAALEEWGPYSANSFKGMFAIAAYNKKTGSLFLIRDQFGIKPLLIRIRDSTIQFSSLLRPFIDHHKDLSDICKASIFDLIRNGYIGGNKTMLKDVYKLGKGEILEASKNGRISISKYYDIKTSSPARVERDKSLERLLRKKINENLSADVTTAILQSSGIDSTLIAALSSKRDGKKPESVTIGFEKNHEVEDESLQAAKICNDLGIKHSKVMDASFNIKSDIDDFIDSIDQPTNEGLNTYLIMKALHNKYKVAVSGQGADEFFGGYSHFKYAREAPTRMRWSSVLKFVQYIHSKRPNRFTESILLNKCGSDFSLELKRLTNQKYAGEIELKPNNSLQSKNAYANMKIQEVDNYLANMLLRDCDAISGHFGIELRPFFVDQDIWEYASERSPHFNSQKDYESKSELKMLMQKIYSEYDTSQKKIGFEVPYRNYLNNDLNNEFANLIRFEKEFIGLSQDEHLKLKKRVKLRKCNRSDWVIFVTLKWLYKFYGES